MFRTSAHVEDLGSVALVPGHRERSRPRVPEPASKGSPTTVPFDVVARSPCSIRSRRRLDGDAIYAGAVFAFAEALLAGVTTTVDFFYLHDEGNENAERRDPGGARRRHPAGARARASTTSTRRPRRRRDTGRNTEDAAQRCTELAGRVPRRAARLDPAGSALAACRVAGDDRARARAARTSSTSPVICISPRRATNVEQVARAVRHDARPVAGARGSPRRPTRHDPHRVGRRRRDGHARRGGRRRRALPRRQRVPRRRHRARSPRC